MGSKSSTSGIGISVLRSQKGSSQVVNVELETDAPLHARWWAGGSVSTMRTSMWGTSRGIQTPGGNKASRWDEWTTAIAAQIAGQSSPGARDSQHR